MTVITYTALSSKEWWTYKADELGESWQVSHSSAGPNYSQAAPTYRDLARRCFFFGGQNNGFLSFLNLPTKMFQKGQEARGKREGQLKVHQKCNISFILRLSYN